MTGKLFLRSVLLVSLFAILVGCGDEVGQPPAKAPEPPTAAPRTVKKQAPEVVVPEIEKTPPAYVYDPAGKRDPFEALLMVRKPVVDDGEPLTPLQKFDLGQFRLAGIIIGKEEPMAMVMAPGGKSYILKIGVKIGKNAGRVVAIQKDGVLVEERFYDFSGTFRKSIQKIQLPVREGV